MAEHGTTEDIAELDGPRRRMEALSGYGAPTSATLMEADRSFHDLVARASDNRVLAAVSRDIREVIGTLWGFSDLDEGDAAHVAEQHRRIAEAIRGAGRARGRRPRCARISSGRLRRTCTGSASRPHLPFPDRGSLGVAMGLVIGIDTGGTFTDMVVFDPRVGPRRLAQDVLDARARRAGRSSMRSTRAASPPRRSRRSPTARPSGRTR